MDGFNTHFGWDTASQSQIDKETGLINGKLVSLMIRFDRVVYFNGKHLNYDHSPNSFIWSWCRSWGVICPISIQWTWA